MHYRHTLALVGDVPAPLEKVEPGAGASEPEKSEWSGGPCGEAESASGRPSKLNARPDPILDDDYWGREVLTQPAAIKTALGLGKSQSVRSHLRCRRCAGQRLPDRRRRTCRSDLHRDRRQLHGFCGLRSAGNRHGAKPFYGWPCTGDGSFTMNPQILIDGGEHGARGCILLLDNGRMAAISGLQKDSVRRRICHNS